MRRVTLILLILIFAPFAYAADINANGPADDATVSPEDIRFSFTVDAYTVVKECSLFIDDEAVKTLQYQRLIPQSLLWSYNLDEGEYEWYVSCITEDDEILKTSPRTLNVIISTEGKVDIIPSGTVQGSYIFEFDFQNSAEQIPILLEDVAPGDFISINLYVPPSRTNRELFVKSKRDTPEKGPYYILNYKGDNYDILLGQNTTVPIGSNNVLIAMTSISGVKADITVYPYIINLEPEEPELPEEPPEEVIEEPIEEPEEVIEEPEEIVEEPVQPTQEPETEEAPKQNFFQSVLSWLVGIFGR